jgi:uncharacterized protein
MTPQERDLIVSLIGRLQQAANQPKDRDAEALIRQGVAAHPDAPYLLVQTVLIQDMALSDAHTRIKDLEQQLAAQSAAPPPPQPTSFLAGARASVPTTGPWGAAPVAPAPVPGPVWTQSAAPPRPAAAPMAAASPWSSLAAPSASSGFLRQAATTAAGVAGGALLFEGIRSLFGPHYGGGFLAGMPAQPGIGETVINNYYDTPAPGTDQGQTDAAWNNDPGGLGPADFGPDQGVQDVGSDQDFSDQDFDSGQDMGDGTIDV